MRINGLYSYINEKLKNSLDFYQLDNTKLIIDGSSISHHLLTQSLKNLSCASDGAYQTYSKCVTNFFNKLIDHKVDFIVILNGTWKLQQQNYILQRLNNDIKYAVNKESFGDELFCSFFLEKIFLEVMKKLKIIYLVSTFKLSNPIVIVSKLLNHPILTANSELFLYGVHCIFFHSLNIYENNDQVSDEITCKIIRPNKFVQSFPGLKVSCLPILSVLFNTEYFNKYTLLRFLNRLNSSKSTIRTNSICYILIDKVLQWLSNHTLKSAAEEIIPLMMSTGKPLMLSKKIIEDIINNFIRMPTSMLKYFVNLPSFNIDEAQISEIQNKFVEFKFDDKNEALASNFEPAENDSQKIKKKVTNFFINDHLTGKLSSFVINLIEHETYIPWYQVEHLEFPSVYEMSIPLISFIYQLVLSCAEEEKVNPLKLYIREKLKIQCREINVEKYPICLQDIRKSDLTIKLEIINEVLLGIKKADSLEGLPKEWRLFTATLVFWMKQPSNPEKGDIYLYTLLLAMFFTISEKKLKSSDNNNLSDELVEKEIDRLTVEENFKSKNGKLIKAIENINSDDAEVQIPQIFSVGSSLKKLSMHTIHMFIQFQCVLEYSRTINALLDFPYHQPAISEIFNSKLIKNLFLYLSCQSQSIKNKIHGQMQPSILQAFKLLEESVIPLLQ